MSLVSILTGFLTLFHYIPKNLSISACLKRKQIQKGNQNL